MPSIQYSAQALGEISDIYDYIAGDNPFYASDVTDRIRRSIGFLEIFPLIGTEISADIRYIVEPKYKFKIVYRYQQDQISIVSVYKYRENWSLRDEIQ